MGAYSTAEPRAITRGWQVSNRTNCQGRKPGALRAPKTELTMKRTVMGAINGMAGEGGAIVWSSRPQHKFSP